MGVESIFTIVLRNKLRIVPKFCIDLNCTGGGGDVIGGKLHRRYGYSNLPHHCPACGELHVSPDLLNLNNIDHITIDVLPTEYILTWAHTSLFGFLLSRLF
jgi:hypothetical protein